MSVTLCELIFNMSNLVKPKRSVSKGYAECLYQRVQILNMEPKSPGSHFSDIEPRGWATAATAAAATAEDFFQPSQAPSHCAQGQISRKGKPSLRSYGSWDP